MQLCVCISVLAMLVIATDGGCPQCSLTVKAASQICQCNFVCALKFSVQNVVNNSKEIRNSGNIKPVFIRVGAIVCVHFWMEGVLNAESNC